MIFTLEALHAKHGDCLLVHSGSAAAPRVVLIDGGPSGVWSQRLRGRLNALPAGYRDRNGRLRIDLAMVSHIDDDHIRGLLDMTRELRRKKEDGAAHLPWNVLQLWHNHFERLLGDGDGAAKLAAAAGKSVTASSSAIAGGLPIPKGRRDTRAIVASVNQGRQLAKDADYLAIHVNPGFGGGLVRAEGNKAKKVRVAGVEWIVLGPADARLDALKEEWKKVVAKSQAADYAARVAAFLDESVFNLASLIVVARAKNRTILLTGDARGDHILDALRLGRFLEGGAAHFDVFKVPHHGSDRNVTQEFFERVTADHYVISADGRHGNPDEPMLEWLVKARAKSARYTVHLTNPVPHATKLLKKLNAGRKFTVVVRKPSSPSLLIELGDPLPGDARP